MSEDPFSRDAGKTRTDEMEEGREGEASADAEGWTREDEPEPGASSREESEDNDGGPPAVQQRPGGPY